MFRKLTALLLLLPTLLLCGALAEQWNGCSYDVQEDGTACITHISSVDGNTLVIPAEINGIPVTAIGDRAGEFLQIEHLEIPGSVTRIGDHAFAQCSNLLDVTLGEGVTSLGDCAFRQCRKLASVTLPDSLREMGDNPFQGCFALPGVTVSEGHPVFSMVDGVLFDHAAGRLVWYPRCREGDEYEIPQGTLEIGAYAFADANKITSVVIPEGVTAIGSAAFSMKMTHITLPLSLQRIDGNPFVFCHRLQQIIISPEHPVFTLVDGVLFEPGAGRLVAYPYYLTAEAYTVP